MVGPFVEGDTLRLYCDVYGGEYDVILRGCCNSGLFEGISRPATVQSNSKKGLNSPGSITNFTLFLLYEAVRAPMD